MYSLIDILREASEKRAVFKIERIFLRNTQEITYEIYSCDLNTYWLREGLCFLISFSGGGITTNRNATVISVDRNKSFLVKFNALISVEQDSFLLPESKFYFGTLPMADTEIKSCVNIAPICYYHELSKRKKLDSEQVNDYIGESLRIFFMDDYLNNNNWITEDHYDNIIYQMENYALFFVENLRKDFKRVDTIYLDENPYEIINRVKTGRYTVKNGNEESDFSRLLSGVEILISIAVKEDESCGC